MAIFRSAASNATPSTSLSISAPAGAASGDVLIAYVCSDEGGNTPAAVEGGWTTGPSYSASDITLTTYYRTLSGAPPSSYGFTNSSDLIGGIIAINPEGGTSPVVAVNGVTSDSATFVTTPAIANVSDPRVYVGIWACDSGFTVSTPPASMTTAHTLLNPGAWSLAGYYQDSPADVGDITRTLTWSGSETLASTAFLVSFTAGSTSYTLTADQGTYTLTGQDAGLNKGFSLSADQGSYALVGSDARVDSEISADTTTFTLTGYDAGMAKGSIVVGEQGAHVVVGYDANLVYSGAGPKVILAEQGTYTLVGQDAALRRAARIIANTGIYTFQGFTVVGGTSPDTDTISTLFRVRKVLLVTTTGRTKWVNYIPIKQIPVTAQNIGRFNVEGAVEVESIGSGTGLVEWVDYIPVVEVADGEAGRWRYDNAGWIPVVFVD